MGRFGRMGLNNDCGDHRRHEGVGLHTQQQQSAREKMQLTGVCLTNPATNLCANEMTFTSNNRIRKKHFTKLFCERHLHRKSQITTLGSPSYFVVLRIFFTVHSTSCFYSVDFVLTDSVWLSSVMLHLFRFRSCTPTVHHISTR